MREMQQGERWGWVGGLSPFSALRDESPAGLHLNVQASLHGAHLHVLVQVSVHVALCCSQFHLRSGKVAVTHTVFVKWIVMRHRLLTYRDSRAQNITNYY